MSLEIKALYFARSEAAISKDGRNLDTKSLADYQNVGVDFAYGFMVGIWIARKLNSTEINDISGPIKCYDPVVKGVSLKITLKVLVCRTCTRGRNCLSDMAKFIDFLETIGYPAYGRYLASGPMCFDRRRSTVL